MRSKFGVCALLALTACGGAKPPPAPPETVTVVSRAEPPPPAPVAAPAPTASPQAASDPDAGPDDVASAAAPEKTETSIRVGATSVSGRLPPEVIARVARHGMLRYRACFNRAIAQNPKLAGVVRVKFVIGPKGQVTKVEDAGQSTIGGKEALQCLKRAIMPLTFPPPENGGSVEVIYPLILAP